MPGCRASLPTIARGEWQICLLALNEAAGWVLDVVDQHPEPMPSVEEKLERFRKAKQHLCRSEIRTIFKATREMCEGIGLPASALMDFEPTREMIKSTFDAARRAGVKEVSLQRMLAEFASGAEEEDES